MSYLTSFKDKVNKKLKDKEEKKIKQNNVVSDKTLENNKTNIEDKNNTNNMVTNESTNSISYNKSHNGGILDASRDDDPVEKLKEIENRIDLLDFYDAPENLDLDRKEAPTFDEEKVKDEIVKILSSDKNIKRQELDNKHKQDTENFESKKQEKIVSYDNNEKKINKVYDSETINLENQAIKRGLARSSIIIGELARVEDNRAKDLLSNYNNLTNDLNSIEGEIDMLAVGYNQALSDLDIEYANRIENELEEKREEYQKKLDEVIEFNNNVEKLEAEYKMKYENNKLDWKEGVLDLTKYGYDEFRTRIKNAKYDYMVSYLSKFPKSEAISIFVSNNNFSNLLGDDYERVYEYLINR